MKLKRSKLDPRIQLFKIESHVIYVLSASSSVSEDEFQNILSQEEIEQGQSIPHAARRGEFLRSRWLYHNIAIGAGPLLRTTSGIPSWAPGLTGALSHKRGHVAICLESTKIVRGIGIDLEGQQWSEGLEKKFCNDQELMIVDHVAKVPEVKREILTAIFSAKESIYKLIYPIGGIDFYFEDAILCEVNLAQLKMTFQIERDLSESTPRGTRVVCDYMSVDLDGEVCCLTSAVMGV